MPAGHPQQPLLAATVPSWPNQLLQLQLQHLSLLHPQLPLQLQHQSQLQSQLLLLHLQLPLPK